LNPELPISTRIPEIRQILAQSNVLILQAPPGAGKSTLLPISLLSEPWLNQKKIILLEPRRLAARSVALRMSYLLGEEIGKTVGYRIRFDNCVSKSTRIEVVTEGILTRMLQQDNALEEVGMVIFDEFHERSLHADLALALCYQAQTIIRKDLRLLIMSATLDGEGIASALNNAPVLTCEGRTYPITIEYLDRPRDERLEQSLSYAIRKALQEKEGDILVFLPGAGEIHRTASLLEQQSIKAIVHMLYGDLPQKLQQAAILPDPNGRRKIILSTSIAETSLTIEGVQLVIDSGWARIPKFDLQSGLTRLQTVNVTKDSAAQRAGRAGRTSPGTCYRMGNEGLQMHLLPRRNPEITDADLSGLMLELSQWGIQDAAELSWINPPPASSVKQANELLSQLGALSKGKITAKGKEMLTLPTHPRIAHMLIGAKNLALATDIAALLEERDPLQRSAGADLGLRIEALRKFRKKEYVSAERTILERIERLALSWRKLFRMDADNQMPDDEDAGILLAAAYPERVAKQEQKNSPRYRLANGRSAKIPEGDPLIHKEWICAAQVNPGKNEGQIFLAAPIDPEDLMHLAELKEVISWNAEKGLIEAYSEMHIGNISIEKTILKGIPEKDRIRLLCEAIRSEGLAKALNWSEECTNWQSRVLSLRKWRTEEEWPDVSDEQLLASLESWLGPFLINLSKREELKRIDLTTTLSSLLPYSLGQHLEKSAPVSLKVPSGSLIRLNYFMDGSAPEMPVRMQEIFGLAETPAVNGGRTKVILHLLSPARRPVQVTQDLRSFWEKTYPEVRTELRRRYPRHSWPDDPWTAQAIRGVLKRKSQG